MNRARRLLLRRLGGFARRVLLMVCPWLMVLGPDTAPAQEITRAEYTTPTRAYPHGVLGDDLEWAAVRITVSRRRGEEGALFQGRLSLTYDIKAPAQMVFEDTRPRLWDVDGDGAPEVVTVLSHQDHGAQLAVIGYRGGAFTYVATTPTIGQRFRWLAPVGAADLDGDGHVELAFVHTPHLGKTLHVWRYREGDFSRVTTRQGLTNHKIGWDHIPGGIRVCDGVPEIITADADWSRIMASELLDGIVQSRAIARYDGPDSLNAALACP